MVTGDQIRAVAATWLLDLTFGGEVFRFATNAVEVTDSSGEVFRYAVGLADFEWSYSQAGPDASVGLTINSSVDWARMQARGVSLERASGTLRRHYAGTVLEQARIVLRGLSERVEYGAPDEPLTLSLTSMPVEQSDTLPEPQAVVEAQTWPKDLNQFDEKLKGSYYPIIIGQPGTVASGLNQPVALNLNQEQQEAIGARFNRKPPPNLFDAPTTQYTGVTIDKDGDGKLGEGDVVKLRDIGGFRLPGADNTTRDHALTAADITFIETDRSNPLLDISNGLSDEQAKRLINAITEFTPNDSLQLTIFDTNSDGKLSVGDVIQDSFKPTSQFDGISGIGFHTLTQAELERYLEGSSANIPQAVSAGGVFVGGVTPLTGDIIPDDRVVDINGQKYSVGFLKDQVKEFADTYVPSGGSSAAVSGEFDWGYSGTQLKGFAFENYIANKFPQGEPLDSTQPPQGSTDSLVNLSSLQKEQLTDLLGARGSDGAQGSAGIRVVDNDGDGSISEGDTALFSVGDANSISQQSKVLSADDVANVNTASIPARVNITAAQKQAIKE